MDLFYDVWLVCHKFTPLKLAFWYHQDVERSRIHIHHYRILRHSYGSKSHGYSKGIFWRIGPYLQEHFCLLLTISGGICPHLCPWKNQLGYSYSLRDLSNLFISVGSPRPNTSLRTFRIYLQTQFMHSATRLSMTHSLALYQIHVY